MSGLTVLDAKGFINFTCKYAVGSRPVIRLMKSACVWVEGLAGKTNFVFFGYLLDIKSLNEHVLKPFDNQIYVIKGIKGIVNFQEKCWTVLENCYSGKAEERVFTAIAAVQHGVKTVSDSAAGLRFIAGLGLVILTPYIRSLTLIKNGFAVTAGVLEIVCRVHHLWEVVQIPIKREEDLRKQQLEWLTDVLKITIQIFSIQLNFFGGCKTLFKDVIKPEDHMPALFFNLWGSGATLATLGYIAVDYIKEPSAK